MLFPELLVNNEGGNILTFNENADLNEYTDPAEDGRGDEPEAQFSSQNEQNDKKTTEDMSEATEASVTTESAEADRDPDEDAVCDDKPSRSDDRAEYEHLIRTKFKELYAEDVQKLINRRFKKLRVLEEKVAELEAAAAAQDIESLLKAERERTILETEERMRATLALNRSRPMENAVLPRTSAPVSDVSKLTRTQRASLALRASRGEKIKF